MSYFKTNTNIEEKGDITYCISFYVYSRFKTCQTVCLRSCLLDI